jgi:hypothetical protein
MWILDSSAKPELGKCGAPGDRSGVIDRFEVDLRYGNFLVRQTDLSLSDTFDVPLARTYNSGDYIQANRSHAFGSNTNHSFDIAPWEVATHIPTRCWFSRTATISFSTGFPRERATQMRSFKHTEKSTRFYRAVTEWNGDGRATFLPDGTKME